MLAAQESGFGFQEKLTLPSFFFLPCKIFKKNQNFQKI